VWRAFAFVMSAGDGHVSLSLSTVRQLADTNPDHIVLEKDTYLIDENNRVIPIPAGTMAVLERGSEKNAAVANFSTAGDVEMNTDAAALSATSAESDVEATNMAMPADSTSMHHTSPAAAAAAAHGSGSIVNVACEVVEATSSDPNPSVSLSDMYVQEEEEVMDESKDEEAVVSASGSVGDSALPRSKDVGQKTGRKSAQKKARKVTDESRDEETVVSASGSVGDSVQSSSKDAARKPVRKSAQKKACKMSDESQDNVGKQEMRMQQGCVPATDEKSLSAAKKSVAVSTSTSPAVSTVSASGRPQRSTPRRSAYELLHGGESKPQRRSHTATAESEQESHSVRSPPGKKLKVSKSGAADEEEQKQSEETKAAGELDTAQTKCRQRRHPAQTTSQTSASSEGCEGSSNCATSSNVGCLSTDELKNSSGVLSSCTPATGDSGVVESTGGGSVNDIKETESDVSESQKRSAKSSDDVEHLSVKQQKQSKKAALSNQDNSHPLHVAAAEKESPKKKVTGKHGFGSKLAKVKGSKKSHVVGSKVGDDDGGDNFKVPGKPYRYFTTDDSNYPVSDSDGESSSSLADDLTSDDVVWMGRRIVKLEQQIRRLQEGTLPQDDKRTSRCWQDVLAEVGELPSEDVDEKLMLTRYERKLRALDRELDGRASFLRIREGCIARRERRILEKESELNKRERDLEHQRRLHGRVKLPSESTEDSNAQSPTNVDSSSASNRKQALEKEVRLELRKQALDRQKHVLADERKKLAAKERELENREHALVDTDLLNMASGFTSSSAVESRGTEANQPNGRTTVEFSDEDDDDFGGNSLSSFGAVPVSLPFGLDRPKHDSDDEHQQPSSDVSCIQISCFVFRLNILCYQHLNEDIQ